MKQLINILKNKFLLTRSMNVAKQCNYSDNYYGDQMCQSK